MLRVGWWRVRSSQGCSVEAAALAWWRRIVGSGSRGTPHHGLRGEIGRCGVERVTWRWVGGEGVASRAEQAETLPPHTKQRAARPSRCHALVVLRSAMMTLRAFKHSFEEDRVTFP